ncbi:unnamed protein product, partial [Owenia fusiformis]
ILFQLMLYLLIEETICLTCHTRVLNRGHTWITGGNWKGHYTINAGEYQVPKNYQVSVLSLNRPVVAIEYYHEDKRASCNVNQLQDILLEYRYYPDYYETGRTIKSLFLIETSFNPSDEPSFTVTQTFYCGDSLLLDCSIVEDNRRQQQHNLLQQQLLPQLYQS